MCEICESVDTLLAEVNDGKRTFDEEVLRATVLQARHVLDEVITDIDSCEKPLHVLLGDVARTMAGAGFALITNARTVHAAAHAERDRLVQVATEAEAEIRNRRTLIEHLLNAHNGGRQLDPEKMATAHRIDLEHIHSSAHDGFTVSAAHITTGGDV